MKIDDLAMLFATAAHGLKTDAIESLIEEGLLERVAHNGNERYSVTGRGGAFVSFVGALPLPEASWKMPGVDALIAPGPRRALKRVTRSHRSPRNTSAADSETRKPGPAQPPVPIEPQIPTDETQLRNLANAMLDRGRSLGEVRIALKLTDAQARAFFEGG